MRIFRDLDMVEYLGSGMPRILKAYSEKAFRFTENFTRMSFPSAEKTSGKASEKASGKTSEKTSEKILEIIQKNNQVTIAQLSDKIGVTTRSIERNIKKLQDTHRLQREGPDHGGQWKIIQP